MGPPASASRTTPWPRACAANASDWGRSCTAGRPRRGRDPPAAPGAQPPPAFWAFLGRPLHAGSGLDLQPCQPAQPEGGLSPLLLCDVAPVALAALWERGVGQTLTGENARHHAAGRPIQALRVDSVAPARRSPARGHHRARPWVRCECASSPRQNCSEGRTHAPGPARGRRLWPRCRR